MKNESFGDSIIAFGLSTSIHNSGGGMSFSEVINRVRRYASQTGEAYLAAADFGK